MLLQMEASNCFRKEHLKNVIFLKPQIPRKSDQPANFTYKSLIALFFKSSNFSA